MAGKSNLYLKIFFENVIFKFIFLDFYVRNKNRNKKTGFSPQNCDLSALCLHYQLCYYSVTRV